MDPRSVVRRRLQDQRLAGDPLGTPREVVAWLGAVQAQDWAECKWSIAQRMPPGATDDDVEAAVASGSIVRTHVLRPTWHLVAAEDVRWLLRLTAARVHRANAHSYRRHGLDDDVLRRAHNALRAALAVGEPRTRPELAAALATAGVVAAGPRLAHITMHAELDAVLAGGPRRGRQQTYVLLEDRLRGVRERAPADPPAELARRYVTGHGPATARDFGWWSGMTVGDARAALERLRGELAVEADDDGTAFYAAPVAAPPRRRRRAVALLVGMFDESTIAFQDVRVVCAAGAPRSAPLERRVVIDGLTVGRWRRSVAHGAVTVEASLFCDLDARQAAALATEAERLGRFLRLPAELRTSRAAPPA